MKTILFVVLFATIIYLPLVHSYGNYKSRQRTLKLDRFFGKCRKYPKAPATIEDVNIRSDKLIFTINFKLRVTEDVSGEKLKMKLKLKRCQNKETLATCEDMPHIEINMFCEFLEMNNTFFTPTLDAFRPRVKCPIKKGVFVLENGHVDVSAISAFLPIQVDNYYWKAEWTVFDPLHKNRIMYCIYVEGKLIYL